MKKPAKRTKPLLYSLIVRKYSLSSIICLFFNTKCCYVAWPYYFSFWVLELQVFIPFLVRKSLISSRVHSHFLQLCGSLFLLMEGRVGSGGWLPYWKYIQSACSVRYWKNFHRRSVVFAISLKPCLRNKMISYELVKWLFQRAVRLYGCKGKWMILGLTWAEEGEVRNNLGKNPLRAETRRLHGAWVCCGLPQTAPITHPHPSRCSSARLSLTSISGCPRAKPSGWELERWLSSWRGSKLNS